MFKFPFSNLHELNLDWILEQVKQFSVLIPPMETAVEDVQALQDDVEQAVTDANAAVTAANQASETAAEALEVAEQAASGTIADGAVTTAKLANNAVTTEKILNGTILSEDMAAGAALGNIADGTIAGAKLATGAAAANIADGTLPGAKIADSSILGSKLADGAAINRVISDGAVTGVKIADDTIPFSKLAPEINDPTIKAAPTIIPFTPNVGASYSTFGGCFYYKIGFFVVVHVGITGLTPNANNDIFTLPQGYRPQGQFVSAGECGETYTGRSAGSVSGSGDILIQSPDQYANIDFLYIACN